MNDISTLTKTTLFHGIPPEELPALLTCLSAQPKQFEKDAFLFRQGEPMHRLGLVLSGEVHIIREDVWGNRTIVGTACQGELFGETYACLGGRPLEVSVVANQPTALLLLDVSKLMRPCSAACPCHGTLLQNLLSVLAQKNWMLTGKMACLTQKTTRDKLLCYLSAQSMAQGKATFTIPFHRQQLADYLAVDRSAMSTALCKLRDEGVLTFHKNQFRLSVPDE